MALGVLLRPLLIALLFASYAGAQAPLPSNRPHSAFVVIGPTADVRGWTSEWVQAEVERTADDSSNRIAPWRNVLGWLDTEAEPFDAAPQLGLVSGPSATNVDLAAVRYPADLRQPLVLAELGRVLRVSGLESLTQIVVEKGVFGYRLSATTVGRRDPATAMRRAVRGRRLQAAARTLAAKVALDWQAARSAVGAGPR